MEKTAEELKPPRQTQVNKSEPEARYSEDEGGEIGTVWASMPARDAPLVSEERHGLSHTVDLRKLPDLEGRLGLDMMVILKEWQQ